MSKILACVDVSAYAPSVADHAAWAALRMNAAVDVLHVIGRKERGDMYDYSGALGLDANAHLLNKLAEADEASARLAQERGRVLLDATRQRLKAAGVEIIDVKHRHGSFVDTVVEMEVDCDLVVIGKRGANVDFATMHLGSNLERVVRSSTRPVMVASRAFRPIERVLLAFDGGPSARKALEYMAAKPLFGGLEFHVATVGPVNAETTASLEAAAATLRRRGSTVNTRVLQGEPETAIGDHVRNASIDLLVMGAYGHSKVRQLLVGSTTSAMVRTCLIPVMLFR